MAVLQTVRHRDTALMAHAAAARLITRVVDAQAIRGWASVVLTGGRNGIALLRAVAESPARDAVDWHAVELWWGDERYLPRQDPDRNDTQARQALLDQLPIPAAHIHPMPAPDDGYGDDVQAAAAAYAAELSRARPPGAGTSPVPDFDVVLLGVGPDTHVASLFPGHPGTQVTERSVVAVREAPKPPPVRISLTLPALRSGREVWLLAAGADKAEAVATALSPDVGVASVPAAGARGRQATLWLLDDAAAAQLP